MSKLYTAHATTVAGRDGHTKTDDGKINLKLSTPGGNGDGSNPEQLFACGYSACFGSAVAAVAKKMGISPAGDISVQADVDLNKDDSGFFISAALSVNIPGIEAAKALEIVEAAHQLCPYSKATRGNINVTLSANDQPVKIAA